MRIRPDAFDLCKTRIQSLDLVCFIEIRLIAGIENRLVL